MLLCTTHPDMSSFFSHLCLAWWLCQNLALPKSSLLRILASLSLYLEIRRNSFSSDQHNPLPANLHQHRPSDISIYFIIPYIFFSPTQHILPADSYISCWAKVAPDFFPSFSLPSSLSISTQVNLFDYMQCTAALVRHQLSFHSEAWRKDYH